MSDIHTIEHFKRLAPEVQRDLARRFGLIGRGEGDMKIDGSMVNRWLLRSKQNGTLHDLGEAVQLAPQ